MSTMFQRRAATYPEIIPAAASLPHHPLLGATKQCEGGSTFNSQPANKWRTVALAALVLILSSATVWAQVNIASTAQINENLTGYLGTSTFPANWSMGYTGGTAYNGTGQTTGSTGGWYGNNNMSFLGSGSASSGNGTWQLKNTSGSTLTGFTLQYVAQQWKSGSASPLVKVYYLISSSGTFPATTTQAGAVGAGWTELTSLGFSDATASITTGATLSQTVSSLSAANNQYIYIRWIHAGGSSADNLGWDTIAFTAALSATPTIIGAATASAFTTTYGTASTAQTFSVSGANLTANLVATAGTGFEVSADNSTFSSSVSYTPSSGTVSSTPVYVRLKADATVSGAYNSVNAVVLSSTSATSQNITTASTGNIVTAKALTVTASAQSKTYGSTLSLGTSAFTSSGLVGSETIGSVTLAANGGTAATDAATTYTITPSAATGGTFTAGNYSITYATGTLTVNPKALTITANDVTKPFGDTLTSGAGSAAYTITSGGFVGTEGNGVTVTITYGTGAAAGDAAGSYPNQVTPSAATGGTFTAGNYSITYASGTITVTADPTISTSGTLSAVDTIYGTASPAPTSFSVSGIFLTGDLTVTPPSGFEVSLSSGSGYSSPLTIPASGTLGSTAVYVRLAAATAFGTYSGNVTISGGGATSKTVATASSAVAKKGLTITGLTGSSKIYDRTTTASFTGTAAYSGLENGEAFSVSGTPSATFATATVGTAKPITITGYIEPSANYSLTQPSLTGSITALALTVTGAGVTNKVYDGTIAATITNATLVGVISPDVVTISGAVSNGFFAAPSVASGVAVTATLTLSSADAGNYSLTQPVGLTGNITKANQTITFGALASKTTTDAPFALTGTASSGLAVTYVSANPAVATVSGSTVTIVGVGSTLITASQAGDANYNAATSVPQTLTVTVPLIAGWDFQTSPGTAAAAAPNSPSSYTASFGSGTIYLDGSFGSSTWITASSGNEVTAFAGTAVNAATGFSTTTTSPACLALVSGTSQSANGKHIVFKFSMANRANLVVSYATQASSSAGFSSHLWEYSTDGTTWTTAETVGSIPTGFGTKTLATITSLNGASTAYLRLTVSGATTPTSNNRLDNIQIGASYVPTISGVTSQSINYGAANVALSGTVSAGAVYPANGETVSVTINGHTVNGTVTNSTGGFWINYNDASLATLPPSPTAYAITYAYAGNAGLTAANDSSTALTVTGIKVPDLAFTIAPSTLLIITVPDLQSNGLASSQVSPNYSFISLGTNSTLGTVITNGSGTILKYAYPTSGTPSSDSFTYTITDGAASAIGAVTLIFTTVAGPSLAAGSDGMGHAVVSFHGLPGYSYHVQRATTLTPTPDWTNAAPVSVPSNGDGSYIWTNIVSDPEGFYRLSYP